MNKLQEALAIFEEEFGELDNFKLLLGAGDGDSVAVAHELLMIARDVQAGNIKKQERFLESALADATITL
jgi:hypothetical protein